MNGLLILGQIARRTHRIVYVFPDDLEDFLQVFSVRLRQHSLRVARLSSLAQALICSIADDLGLSNQLALREDNLPCSTLLMTSLTPTLPLGEGDPREWAHV